MYEYLNNILEKENGNIIEIGAGVGETTVMLLEYAKKFDRKVIVIDPHELGWNDMPESYGKPYKYDEFIYNTKSYHDYLIHIRLSSQDKGIKDELVKYTPYSFAFVDGLQYKSAVLGDLRLMDSFDVSIMCLDDYNRVTELSQVPLAVEEFIREFKSYDLVTESVTYRQKAFLIKKN